MPRLLLLALGLTVALAGCDTYGIDDPIDPPDPVDPPPVDTTGTTPVNNEDLAVLLGCPTVGSAVMGNTVSGSLVATDCTLEADAFPEYEGGEYLDAYAFTVSSASTVTIDLDSNSFDPVLVLLDEEMNLIDWNDDRVPGQPPGDSNSTVSAELAPGRYVAVATSFYAGDQGTYTLRMAAE